MTRSRLAVMIVPEVRVMKKLTNWLTFAALPFLLVLAFPSAGGSSSASAQIVFIRNHLCRTGPQGSPGDCGRGEVALVRAGGSGLRTLTHNSVTEASPRWSPDRRTIAFIRPRRGGGQVWLMAANGTHQRALTRLRKVKLYGAWEPSLDWSPNGRQIVFAAYPSSNGGAVQLFLANVRTGTATRLAWTAVSKTNPVWSPNGRWIAFVQEPPAPQQYAIILLSTATHRMHQLGHALNFSSGPSWSPDSRRIVFGSGGKLAVINADGTHRRSLGVFGEQPSWSPDGRWIVYTSGGDLAEIRPDGSGRHLITHANSIWWRNLQADW
jgi:Tol biopolymer transport system component